MHLCHSYLVISIGIHISASFMGVRDLLSFLGGRIHFGMFCPNRRIHARIRASPENLAEWGGGRGASALFFARPKVSVFYSSIARIFSRFIPKFRPKFYIGKIWEHSATPPPPPPPTLPRPPSPGSYAYGILTFLNRPLDG